MHRQESKTESTATFAVPSAQAQTTSTSQIKLYDAITQDREKLIKFNRLCNIYIYIYIYIYIINRCKEIQRDPNNNIRLL